MSSKLFLELLLSADTESVREKKSQCFDIFFYGVKDIGQRYLFWFNPALVYRLGKVLNTLERAPRIWYNIIVDFQIKLSSKQLGLDQIVLSQNCQLFLVLYMDNLIHFASDNFCLTKIQVQLIVQFKITDFK